MFKLKLYNIMTAGGFNGMGYDFFMAWIGLALLVLLGAVAKKWLGEEEIAGIPYNFLGSFLGLVVYFILVTLTGNGKWSFLAGLIGMFLGGFGFGLMWGGNDE